MAVDSSGYRDSSLHHSFFSVGKCFLFDYNFEQLVNVIFMFVKSLYHLCVLVTTDLRAEI